MIFPSYSLCKSHWQLFWIPFIDVSGSLFTAGVCLNVMVIVVPLLHEARGVDLLGGRRGFIEAKIKAKCSCTPGRSCRPVSNQSTNVDWHKTLFLLSWKDRYIFRVHTSCTLYTVLFGVFSSSWKYPLYLRKDLVTGRCKGNILNGLDNRSVCFTSLLNRK